MVSASAPSSVAMRFDIRKACPCCGGLEWVSRWSGRFSEPTVAALMSEFYYSGDYEAALGDQEFDLVTCSGCEFNFHRFVPGDEWLPVLYGQWTDATQVGRFEAAHTTKRNDAFATAVQRLKLVMRLHHLVLQAGIGGPVRLLDFGCGDGEVLATARLLGLEAYGIDLSDTRADTARTTGVRVFSNLEEFDEQAGVKVHAVVLSQVLEHVSTPRGLLEALATRIVPGGVLFVGVPNCEGIDIPKDFGAFYKVQPLEHINAFTPKTLQRLLERAGFRRLRSPPAFVSTRPASAVRSAGTLLFQRNTTDQFFSLTR